MRIGLVRHFEVDCSHKFLMSAEDFRKWDSLYSYSPIKNVDFLISNNWNKCYCSDLYRAVETANCIYKGNIIKSKLIREVPITPIVESSIKLPYIFWLLAGRIAWLCSHKSQSETIKQTKDRVDKFISRIQEEDNVLIVTHGFLMVQIQRQLTDRGFIGDSFKRAKCGKVYVFQKSD